MFPLCDVAAGLDVVSSSALRLVCRGAALRMRSCSSFFPSLLAAGVYSHALSGPVVILEVSRSPRTYRQVLKQMGFWEDAIGVKWSIPARDCWVVAVMLQHCGIWMYDMHGGFCCLYLSGMQRRHMILPAYREAQVLAALGSIPSSVRVRIQRRGDMYWWARP